MLKYKILKYHLWNCHAHTLKDNLEFPIPVDVHVLGLWEESEKPPR